MHHLLAQNVTLGPVGGNGEGLGPFGNLGATGTSTSGINGITNYISAIIGALTVVAAIWFLFNILFGGYQWMSSGGDPKKIGEARDHITHAFIGMVIVVGSWSLIAVVGQFFGFNTLNPAAIIKFFPQ